MRFNKFMQSHFAGCRLLAHARDTCRNRQVKVYALPGEFDVVGVSDGVDAWMAPVVADPFTVNVGRLLQQIREGKDPAVAGTQAGTSRPRMRISLDDAPAQPTEGVRRERPRV